MTDAMSAVYRHDVHKLNGRSHDHASERIAGITVNQAIPHGADADAAAMSRPSGEPTQTVESHETHYRLSLIDGASRDDSQQEISVESIVTKLLTRDDPTTIHRMWLNSNIVSAFSESVYYPYTSLKYHTLLVAALFDNYRSGHEFDDLYLIVDGADEITPHRTVYADEQFSLRIDSDPEDHPSTRLGTRPWRSWASTWNYLTVHPLDTATDTYDMVLDANLRRIGAWSTALQYIEDFREVFNC